MRGHNKDEDYIWIEVTQDEYRHIIKMADSAKIFPWLRRDYEAMVGIKREDENDGRIEEGSKTDSRFLFQADQMQRMSLSD